MGTIFGSNGDRFNRQKDTTFYDGVSGERDRIFHSGNAAYGEDEDMFTAGGVSSYGDKHIFGSGNRYECDGKTYTRVGNTLFGPNSERWTGGDMSDSDIRDIISRHRR